MQRLFLVFALLTCAMTASASVTYTFASTGGFGTTDWQFTVPDFLSAPDTFITSVDSYSSSTLGSLLSIEVIDPFTSSPSIETSGTTAGLDSPGWTGPFNQDGTYSIPGVTGTSLTITGTGAPEPSSLALIGLGGMLLAFMNRRGAKAFRKS